MRAGLVRRKSPDLAIDLGTSHSRIADRASEVVADVPSVVAFQSGNSERTAIIGEEAHRMLGRAPPGTTVSKPIEHGIVSDFHATEVLLKQLLRRCKLRPLQKPKLLISVPSNISEAERRAVQECARAAGGREITLVSSILSSAIGVGLPILDPVGSMVVDIGAGRTDVSVISLGGLVVHKSSRIAGSAVENAIAHWISQAHNVSIGERTANKLKMRIGSAIPINRPQRLRIRGRDIDGGSPKELTLTTNDMAAAIQPATNSIAQCIAQALSETPPELAGDIIDRGILLCGGGSQLPGLDEILRKATGLPVLGVEQPEHANVKGSARLLSNEDLLERLTQ